MNFDNFDKETKPITEILKDIFEIGAIYRQEKNFVFSLTTAYEHDKVIKLLKERLKLAGYTAKIDLSSEDTILLTIDPNAKIGIPPLNIILFFLTLGSIYFMPVFFKNLISPDFTTTIERTLIDLSQGDGIIFTLAMISILFVHEMGHFMASRRRNIITSWPYFIPAPNFIGTFGAVIKSKSPFWNRRDLIEVGAAGPIAGWIVAILWLFYGLTQSGFVHPTDIIPGEMTFSMEGESILMKTFTNLLIGTAPEGYYYRLSEAAFAGWVGLLVTAINLLPIGQLDGGHIVYGLFQKKQHILGKIAMAGLVLLGFQSTIWWVFAIFGIVFGVKHPPTLDDGKLLSKPSTIMAVISLIILFLSFTPVPFR